MKRPMGYHAGGVHRMADNPPLWPTADLPLGLLQGYRFSDRERQVETPTESGPPRSRLKSRTPVRDFYFDLRLTSAQLAVFDVFYERELGAGINWFYMPMRTGAGVNLTLVKFPKGGKGPARADGMRWRIQCHLISYQRMAIVLDDDTLAALSAYGTESLQSSADVLHNIIHRDW